MREKGAHDVGRDGVETADPSREVGPGGRTVRGVVGGAQVLVEVDDLLHLGRKRLLEPFRLCRERREAGARAGEHDADRAGRLAENVLEGEPAAP